MVKLSPSILSASFTNLGQDIAQVQQAGAEYLHIDVMDGLFVPNISIGVPVVQSIRKATDMVLDVHLMITKPGRYVDRFIEAGADIVVFHLEADEPQEIQAAINQVKAQGKKVGLSIKPKTPAETLLPYVSQLDMILIMTVEPGFGGQRFMEDQLEKIAKVRAMITRAGTDCELEVDGGIDAETAKLCVRAGADVLVAGSAVFGKVDRKAAMDALRGE